MMPAKYNLTLYRGDSWSITLRLLTDGVVDDLTDITWLSQMRETPRSAATTANIVVTVPDPTSGEVTLYVPSDVVTTLPSSGVWDLQGTTEGQVKTWLMGKVTVQDDVTHE